MSFSIWRPSSPAMPKPISKKAIASISMAAGHCWKLFARKARRITTSSASSLPSPRAAVGFFITAATIDTASLGVQRSMTMPGVSATVGEEIESLRKAAGDKAVALIKRVDDPFVAKIVAGWAGRFDAKLADKMGFKAEKNFDEIIKVYQEDEMSQ